MPTLPKGTIFIDPTFDVNKSGGALEVSENGLATLKEKEGLGTIQGTYAMTNNGQDKSFYYWEFENNAK